MDGDGHPLHLASCRVGSCRPEDGADDESQPTSNRRHEGPLGDDETSDFLAGAAGGTQNPDLPDPLENRDMRGVGQPGQGDDQGGAQNQADDSGAAL